MTHMHAIPLVRLFHYLIGTALAADLWALFLLFVLKFLRMSDPQPVAIPSEIYFDRMKPYTQDVRQAAQAPSA